MATEDQNDSLPDIDTVYDYLYRDSSRIASYYAQIFGALLERTESSQHVGEHKGAESSSGANAGLVLAGAKASQRATSDKQVFSPHDIVTGNIISYLYENGFVADDVDNAPNGAIIAARGTVFFVDRYMSNLASGMFKTLITNGVGAAFGVEIPKNMNKQTVQLVDKFLTGIATPSSFILHTPSDSIYRQASYVVGTVKESEMAEPITDYYFKHGDSGVSDVVVLGVKEIPRETLPLVDTPLIGMSRQMAKPLSETLFPKNAVRVTPIVIYREVPRLGS